MPVLINEVEVVVEPPMAPAGEASPPSPQGAAPETPPPSAPSPGALRAVICHLQERRLRVRAH